MNSSLSGDASLVNSGFSNPPDDPLILFSNSLEQASMLRVSEPKAFTLATVGENGRPSSRVIIFKTLTEDGLIFGSSSTSLKGKQMSEAPYISGTFWWQQTIQQINFTGTVEKLDFALSDKIFLERDRSARAISNTSEQSQPIEDCAALRKKVNTLISSNSEIPHPKTWSAYRVRFNMVEFFVGNRDRFHDRLQYNLVNEKWTHTTLQP